jgi:hypothetical protein
MDEATAKIVWPMTKMQLTVLREWCDVETKRGRCIRLHPSWVIGLLDEIVRLRGKIESGGQDVWEQKQVEEAEVSNG